MASTHHEIRLNSELIVLHADHLRTKASATHNSGVPTTGTWPRGRMTISCKCGQPRAATLCASSGDTSFLLAWQELCVQRGPSLTPDVYLICETFTLLFQHLPCSSLNAMPMHLQRSCCCCQGHCLVTTSARAAGLGGRYGGPMYQASRLDSVNVGWSLLK